MAEGLKWRKICFGRKLRVGQPPFIVTPIGIGATPLMDDTVDNRRWITWSSTAQDKMITYQCWNRRGLDLRRAVDVSGAGWLTTLGAERPLELQFLLLLPRDPPRKPPRPDPRPDPRLLPQLEPQLKPPPRPRLE